MLAIRQNTLSDAMKLFGMAVLGTLFSVGLHYAWKLDTRWFVVVIAAVVLVSVAMCFAQIFSDFLLVLLFATLPLMSFNKWFWPSGYSSTELGNLVYGGMLGLGLMDFLVAGLYMSWFFRVFIERSAPLPRLNFIDSVFLLFLALHFLSTFGSYDPRLGFQATEYLGKFGLLYFYVSRNLKSAHLPWLLAALCTTVLAEAALGVYQHYTGNLVGIALDKGAGGSDLSYQYSVPGLEAETRATGTFYDSHALGNFIAMVIPFMFVAFLIPKMSNWIKFLFLSSLGLAAIALYFSYSRSAWVGGAIALAIGIVVIVTVWRERQVILPLIVFSVAGLVAAPFAAKYIYDRFVNSPAGTITHRLDMYRVALTVLHNYPVFGVGPGNYMEALKRYDSLWLESLPVHNVMLWIACETGLVGLALYLTIVFSGMKRFWGAFSRRRDLAGRVAMAGFIALVAQLLDGLTDPLFREPSVFTLFWILIALAVALPNLPTQEPLDLPQTEEPVPA